MKERKTRYATYNINYHIVWIPKYRRAILKGKIKEELLNLFESVAKGNQIQIIQAEIMPDHVHLFVSAPPRLSPAKVVNMFKGVSARWLRERFPELKKLVSKDALWTRTYYIGTAGHVSSETIRKYIEEQIEKEDI